MTVVDQQFPAACISHAAVRRLDVNQNGQVSPDELAGGFQRDEVAFGFGGAVIARGFPVIFAPCQAPSAAVTSLRQQARTTLNDTAVLTGPVRDEHGAVIRTVDVLERNAGQRVKTMAKDGSLVLLNGAPKDAFGFVANDGELAELNKTTLLRIRAAAEDGSRVASMIDTALDLMALRAADPERAGRARDRLGTSERALRAVSIAPDADFHQGRQVAEAVN